jgi:Zinc finger, C2H2 type
VQLKSEQKLNKRARRKVHVARMELHFAPHHEQVGSMKADFASYGSCSEVNATVNGILTPTTPSTKSITADNPFHIAPPFQPFSYSHSPTGCYQVSPIEFSPSDKPSAYGNDCYAVLDEGNYYNNCGFTSVVDTPDSVFDSAKDANQFDYDDNYFKFDPDTVEKFMPHADILDLDTDYINYNEENCNSKNQSPCSSPMDPWILSHAMMEQPSRSPRIENTQQFAQIQSLPSINQAFSTHFTTVDSGNTRVEAVNNAAAYEQNFLDSFDAAFFEDFAIDKSDSNDANANANAVSYISSENYNFVAENEKPNREFKNIWDGEEKLSNAPTAAVSDVEKIQNRRNLPQATAKPKAKAMKYILAEPDDSEQQLICFWKDCNKEFNSQSSLVLHIEKTHVCSAKGDEYTCYWADCPRQTRSFNARYKLLIHMRVHSGEKPNKCPVSEPKSLA